MTAMPLSDSQLLALSTLVYRIDRARSVQTDDTVGIVARNVKAVLEERQAIKGDATGANASQQMTYGNWYTLLAGIEADRSLSRLVVDAVDIDAQGAKMMLLADADNNAYAVFAGTGIGEWEDNATAAYSQDSLQQLGALQWFLRACEGRGYRSITACGHSKGGNKALYLAVRAGDLVDRAVGFDAQGFSREFVRAYGDQILANTEKITSYSLDNDYVNGLLASIVLHSRRIYLDGSHVDSMIAYHSPFAMFAPQHGASGTVLELGVQTAQGKFGKVFKDFSAFALENAPEHDYRQMCQFVGAAMENILTPYIEDSDRSSRAVELAASEGCRLLLGYLARFFEQSSRGVSPVDIVALLLPGGKRGATVVDDAAIGALETVSALLKALTR